MSAFEIVVTPTSVKNARRKIAAREPTSVVLAPFSAKSVVTFDDIPVTKTARRFISIFNPSDQDLTITVSHSIDPEFGITFEWVTSEIPSNKSVTMELVWSPKHEIRAKDMIRLTDNRHFIKDVSLVFKSIDQASNKSSKPTAVKKTSHNMTGKLKIKPPSPPQRLLRQAISSSSKSNSVQTARGMQCETNVKSMTFAVAAPKTPLREQNVFSHQENVNCNDGKENISPTTPAVASTIFDQFQFTPVTHKHTKLTDVESINHMASLPTPTVKPIQEFTFASIDPSNITQQSNNLEITSFQPVIASTVGKEAVPLPLTKLTELEACRKLFDAESFVEMKKISPIPVLNETHTIVSASIATTSVEENIFVVNALQETFNMSPKQVSAKPSIPETQRQLLVPMQNSPRLQKKFQSMKNLDYSSTNTRMLKDNQGSMPNLAAIQEIQSIESNRYFFSKFTDVTYDPTKQFTDIPTNNESIVSLNMQSFSEKDILAQSSRLDLNVLDRGFAVPKSVNNCGTKRSIDDESVKQKTPKSSPPKRSRLDYSSSSSNSNYSNRRPTKGWSGVKPKKFLYSIPKLNLTKVKREEEEERIVFFDPEYHIKTVINPDAFAATTVSDPFLSATMYLDDECIEKHELNFKKWLNALVAIPWEVDCDKQQQSIDFGKLFNDVRGKDLNMAETKEVVSSNYLTKHRMESLRRTATALFTSADLTKMFQNLCVQIEKGQLKVRDSLEIHLDVVLQREALELLLCFNPLWLRIGLEMIYGEVINMNHNFDIVSLSRFIVNRLFKNKHLEQKYSKAFAQKSEQLNKFTLKKLFMLIVFLDKAKANKIITFNPCLFVKTSPYKEMKKVLFKFSTLILGHMGDIQRDLKRIGVVFTHTQTHIEEFDYAFRNLAVDLRDGIRLTKVMEIILLRDDMVNRLRVPAISRLQKVFNVNLALTALKDADYVISGNITAAEIADGHREKTLSLLWQIIYKFRAPKFNAAAATIQLWWRRSWLKVNINRRIREKRERIRNAAATRIQAAYRGYLSRKYTKVWREERTCAAIILQSHIRRYIAQHQYHRKWNAANYIKRWFKFICLTNRLRNQYLARRTAVLTIQKWYRRIQLAKKIESFVPWIRCIRDEMVLQNRCASILQQRYRATCLMRVERHKFLKIRSSVIVIQQRLRSFLLMKKDRTQYLRVREAIVTIQTRYRANLQMKLDRREFYLKKSAVSCIQKFVRASIEAKRVRREFLLLKQTTVIIQQRYRARLKMLEAVQQFDRFKRSVITIQQHFRARIAMRKEFISFQKKKQAAIVLQTRYRSVLEMRRQRQRFLLIKSAVQLLQQRWKATLLMRQHRDNYRNIREATITIQRRIVANRKMVEDRTVFVKLKNAATFVQAVFRAKLCMHEEKTKYQQLRWACMYVQQRYRANKLGQIQLESYQRMKHFATCLQRRFRANNLMKFERRSFLELRDKTVTIQRLFRGKLEMRQERRKYLNFLRCVIFVQRKYRAKKAMEIDFQRFELIKKSVKVIQDRYRAAIQMRHQRQLYLKQKSSAIKIQRWMRSIKLSREERQKFLMYRQNVVNIQNRYRAKLIMHQIQSHYKSVQWAVLFIQRKFRANRAMQHQRNEFHQLRRSVVAIQRRYRGKCAMKQQILEYQLLTKSTKTIQMYFRSYKSMKIQRESFLMLRTATITIQQRFRSFQLTQTIRREFIILKRTTIFIQTLRRANVLMRKERLCYLRLRNAAVAVQTRFRANRSMRIQREIYQRQLKAAVVIQNYFRATKKMQLDHHKYVVLTNAVIFCQRQFRANLMMLEQRCAFLVYKSKVICIQIKYRALLHMRKERNAFELLKKATICIQLHFRSNVLARNQRIEYLAFKRATIFIQRKFRANKAMKMQRDSYLKLRKSCYVLQSHVRANAQMKIQRAYYNNLREATIVVQRRYRANHCMKLAVAQYEKLKIGVITIQRKFRATLLMRQSRKEYLLIVRSTVLIQRKFRSYLVMKQVRQEYLTLLNSVLLIQRKLRSTLLARNIRQEYNSLRSAAITIQRRFRATVLAKKQRLLYLQTRAAVLTIQHRYISFKLMQRERMNYQHMHKAATVLQTKYRAHLVMKENRHSYLQLRTAAIQIQTRYRANVLMKAHRRDYLMMQRSAVLIQNWFRATILTKKLSNQYKLIRCLVICIQQKFRAKLSMRIQRQKFLQLRAATILVQQKYRANKQMIMDQSHFQRTKSTVLGLQTRIRGFLARKKFQESMTPDVLLLIKQRKCVKKIQAHWRGFVERKKKGPRAAALKKIRKKVELISRNVKPEKVIRNVLTSHVKQLQSKQNIAEKLNLLATVRKISDIAPYSLVDDAVFLANVCHGTLTQSIRSEMDKMIIEHSSHIILNMARCEQTAFQVQTTFEERLVLRVAQILLHWCLKDSDIFDTLCTVIYVFAECPEMNEKMRQIWTATADVVFTLNEIKKLVIKKEILRKKKSTYLKKEPLTLRQKNQLPMLKTDLYMKSNKPNIFQCSVFAFDTILMKLRIENSSSFVYDMRNCKFELKSK